MMTVERRNRSPRGANERRAPRRRVIRLASIALATIVFAQTATAGTLAFFANPSSPGVPLAIPTASPAVALDVAYSPATSEGGGVYGFSEIRLLTTGDLTFTGAGFFCTVASCLHFPLPFTGGDELLITGGNDLTGETAGTLDLVSISVEGTAGFVVVVDGDYLDASGASGAPGAIQVVNPSIVATVPEPGFAVTLVVGALLILGPAGRKHRSR